MPIVRVEMLQGRSTEQKSELVKALTDDMVRITGCSAEAVFVVIEDVAKENWGIAGQLCSEKYPD